MKVIASGNRHAPTHSSACRQKTAGRGPIQSGYLLTPSQLNVNNYPVEIIDGQAFIATLSEESAP